MIVVLLAALIRVVALGGADPGPGLGVGLAAIVARTGAWWRRWAAPGGIAHRVVRWACRRSRARA